MNARQKDRRSRRQPATSLRNRQHPLSRWNLWDHSIYPMGSVFCHSSATTSGTKTTTLTRKRHQPMKPARPTFQPRKSFFRVPASQESFHFLVDMRRQLAVKGRQRLAKRPLPSRTTGRIVSWAAARRSNSMAGRRMQKPCQEIPGVGLRPERRSDEHRPSLPSGHRQRESVKDLPAAFFLGLDKPGPGVSAPVRCQTPPRKSQIATRTPGPMPPFRRTCSTVSSGRSILGFIPDFLRCSGIVSITQNETLPLELHPTPPSDEPDQAPA